MDKTLFTDADILNANIRAIMRQLRGRLADGNIATNFNLDSTISDEQVERTRSLLYGGIPSAPIDSLVDPSWITRFNIAIAQGDQDKAIQILVDKEDRLQVSWTEPVALVVKKYIIYYKDNYYSDDWDGQGLMFNPNSTPMDSPFEVTNTFYTNNEGSITLDLFGHDNTLREFAVQSVDYNNQFGAITPIYRKMSLSWEEPNSNIVKYKISYNINERPGYGLLLSSNNEELSSEFYITKDELENNDYPQIDVYTTILNGNYAFNIIAMDKDDNSYVVTSIALNTQKQPCYNEYCELIRDVADTPFGDIDRINALLWYFNYIFFLDNQNWWCASRMVVERKNRDTMFPKTVPWFFPPILKTFWERQESDDQFVTYLKQSLKIPVSGNNGQIKLEIGTLDVYQNLIDEYIIFEVSGTPGDLDVYVSTPSLNEEYNNINTIQDLQLAMTNSSIGEIKIIVGQENTPLTWTPFRTYSREKLTITRKQENIFIFAYFGDEANTRDTREYTSLDPSPLRRIRLEKWDYDYSIWLDIHESLFETWKAILTLNPLGLILDVDTILKKNINPNTLRIPTIEDPNELSEEIINRIVQILGEDDVLTPKFTEKMTNIYDYLSLLDPTTRVTNADKTLMSTTLDAKSKVLNNEKTDDFLDIFLLPYGWDLQRVALVKLNETLLWVDVADFNDIANPLDTTEVFEGRVMALPKFPSANKL